MGEGQEVAFSFPAFLIRIRVTFCVWNVELTNRHCFFGGMSLCWRSFSVCEGSGVR
jgi:hypothetical protein